MKIQTESTFVDVRGKSIQLTTGGEGPPLLYLHSAGGETEWTGFHDKLAESFKVYLPAHPGFANSDGLDKIHSAADYAWHYVDFLAAMELTNIPVIGFSLGGWIGMELAILRPELISRLLLVDSAGVRVESAPMAELFIDDLDQLRQLLFFDPESPAVEEAMPLTYEDSRILLWLKAREATARVGWNPYLHNPRLPEHLFRIQCPTKILWGAEDKLLPVGIGQYLAEAIPHAELEVLEETGHMLPFEKPDQFVQIAKEFLLG